MTIPELDAPPDEYEAPRRIPTNVEAEQSLLGAMILSEWARREVLTKTNLSAADLHLVRHRVVWEAIVRLDAAGAPVDATTVLSELMKDPEDLRMSGGGVALHDLIATALPAAVNIYARAVADAACFRRLVIAGTRIAELGYGLGDVESATSAARAEVETAVAGGGERARTRILSEHLGDLIDRLDSMDPVEGIPWPWPDVDRLLNPISPGQLIVIGARPGGGKSLVGATGLGMLSALKGYPVLVLTIEMSAGEYVTRMVSAKARVLLTKLKKRQLNDEDRDRVARAQDALNDIPLLVDDHETVTLEYVRAAIRRGVPTADGTFVKPKVVIIDYLQLMSSVGRVESRQQEVAALSRGLKIMAKAEGVSVVALAQLNRGPESRADKRPMISDLRESGSIENDADVVILLHREDMYDKETERAGEVDFIVAKQRDGWTGDITLAFQGHYSRIENMARDDDPWAGAA